MDSSEGTASRPDRERRWFTLERALLAGVLILQALLALEVWRLHQALTAREAEAANSPLATRNESSQLRDETGQRVASAPSRDAGDSSAAADPAAGSLPPPAARQRFPWDDPWGGFWEDSPPLTQARALHRRMDQLFTEALSDFERMETCLDFDHGWAALGPSPAMDMRDTGDRFVILLSLPGLSQSDLDITLEGRLLTVASKGRSQARHNREAYAFERRVLLPGPVPQDGAAEVVLTNGLLKISIPKAAAATPGARL
jgi:HSP20 family molecular chaperone IbpA